MATKELSLLGLEIGLLTYDQAASQLPFSVDADTHLMMRRLIARGSLDQVQIGDQTRIRVEDLKRFMSDYLDATSGKVAQITPDAAPSNAQLRAALGLPPETMNPLMPLDRTIAWRVEKWEGEITAELAKQMPTKVYRETKPDLTTPQDVLFQMPLMGLSGTVNAKPTPELVALFQRPLPTADPHFPVLDTRPFKNMAELYLASRVFNFGVTLAAQRWQAAIGTYTRRADQDGGFTQSGLKGLYQSRNDYQEIVAAVMTRMATQTSFSISAQFPSLPGDPWMNPVSVSVHITDGAIIQMAGIDARRLPFLAF